MADSSPLPIVTAADQAFLPGLWALLASLRRHEPHRAVHVLDCGMSQESRLELRDYWHCEIQTVAVAGQLPKPSVGSMATYARLLVPELLRTFHRVIYLDADTVVLSDLAPLDTLTLTAGDIVAACIEPYTPTFKSSNGVANYAALKLSGDAPYFNAGVLVIDMMRWRSARVTERALAYLQRTDIKISLFDQEALNVAIVGQWQSLPPEWNVSRYWLLESRRQVCPGILEDARIVHFLSPEKPWLNRQAIHPWLLEKYDRYSEDYLVRRTLRAQ